MFAAVSAVGSVLLVIGSLLDARLVDDPLSALNSAYIDGNGLITLLIGLVAAVVAVLLIAQVLPNWCGWVIVFLASVGALVAVIDMIDVRQSLNQIESVGGSGKVGPALWVCLLGGLVAIVGGGLTAIVDDRD